MSLVVLNIIRIIIIDTVVIAIETLINSSIIVAVLVIVLTLKVRWHHTSCLVLTSCVYLSELFAQVVMERGCASG